MPPRIFIEAKAFLIIYHSEGLAFRTALAFDLIKYLNKEASYLLLKDIYY